VIRIGEPNPDLDELLEARRVDGGVYHRRESAGRCDERLKNEVANAALVETQTKAGYAASRARGAIRKGAGRLSAAPWWSGSRGRTRKRSGGRSAERDRVSSSVAARPSWSCSGRERGF